jgi:hypothetical protein
MVGAEQGNFENFESLDRWKWLFQSLLYFFGIMICESMLFMITEIRTWYLHTGALCLSNVSLAVDNNF